MTNRLTKLAKRLRKKTTNVEALLWQKVKARQFKRIKFRRQQPIEDFIVDFVSFEKRVIIELDGGQHTKNSCRKDLERDRLLSEAGFTVLRFWNNEVLENFDGVLGRIRETCLH